MRSGRLREFGTDACRIVHGDALEVLDDAVPDGTVDLVFADPPYNLGKRFGTASDSWPDEASYLAWTRCWLDLCVRKLAPTGSMYVMASTQAMPHVDLHLRGLVTILSRIVWHYDSSGIQARQRFGSLYEPSCTRWPTGRGTPSTRTPSSSRPGPAPGAGSSTGAAPRRGPTRRRRCRATCGSSRACGTG